MAGNSSDERRQGQEKIVVSVVIPVHNAADTIKEALDSALAQGIDLEVIVVDDASGDHLNKVMAGYSDNPVIRYIKNKTNLGVAASRNRGVSAARGHYVAFLDADDRWTENKLKLQLKRLEAEPAVLCCTARELMTPTGELTGRVIPVPEVITYPLLLRGNVINCSSVLIRRDAALEFPMEHEDSHEDYITWIKVLRKYGKAIAVNQPLLKYRLSSKGKSGSKLHSAGMTFKVYRYSGFSIIRSCWYFIQYAGNGVMKYLFIRRKGR